ncbi:MULTISPECIES: AarF/ABC1/UbiB kinase family protein [unclassified Mycobacterium]|uniref:ABC1 kinase family protein n=1 Tax=unclassified Mycobacterium TaxID=2642494 RepID=UPI000490C37E|nr:MULTISPECIES: AarF/ABC1/UbiB kinase family protein [unclassified Mycobacterium]
MTPGDQPTDRAARGARVGQVAARAAARAATSAVRQPFLSEEQKAQARDEQMLRLADDLAATLGTMKGAAMKLGQLLSLLNFGLSSAQTRDEFSRRLSPLFSRAPAVDNAVMFRLMDSEWGARRGRVRTIEPEPVATASLGQVYRARLTDGRDVAVKVQYPWARSAVRADLKNLALLVRLRAGAYPVRGLNAVVAEVSRQITAELDYRRELTNHRAVFEAHREHPVFVIPEPIDELCTDRVLVTEYLDGTQLHHLTDVDQTVRDHIGEAVFRFYCANIYTSGEFCADPHPGNILHLPDNRIGFVDFGLYVRMSRAEVDLERSVLKAVMRGDAATAHRLASVAGFIVDAEALPPVMALEYMRAVAGWYLTPGLSQVTDKVAYKALSQAMLPQSDYRSGIFKQRMHSAHAFSRRTEMSVCALLGTLQAQSRWHDIASEWALDAAPATEMGQQIARWRSRIR